MSKRPIEDTSVEEASEHSEASVQHEEAVFEESVGAMAQDSSATISELQHELEQMTLKADLNLNKAQLAQAEAENARRRAQKDVASAHKFALQKFVESLLPAIDSLERAQETAANAGLDQDYLQGIELTIKMFLDVLSKHGVTTVDPQGEKFDAHHHQALSMQPSADVEAGTIIMVAEKGYALNERLIRPARVIVAQAPTKEN